MRAVRLDRSAGVGREVLLAPLTGADEAAVDPSCPARATLGLLRRTCLETDGTPLDVDRLTVCAADRLTAELYRSLYPGQVQCRASCSGCGESYEFAVDLTALIARQDEERVGAPDDDGFWPMPTGGWVRAPTVAEIGRARSTAALLQQLVRGDAEPCDDEQITAFLERAAPVLSLDVAARCPHCGRDHEVRFDLAQYLALRLSGEKPFLLREIHLLACHYGWPLSDILSLSRSDRRAFAAMIEAARGHRANGALRP